MALSDDILQMIRQEIKTQLTPSTFRGSVQSTNPTQVVIDGSSQPIAVLTDDEYVPNIGDRVYVLRLGTDWVLVGKVIPIGGITRPSLNGGYAEMYLNGDQAWGASILQPNMALGPSSDDGWRVDSGFFLKPPPTAVGLWRMSVSMRWNTSIASASSSYRYIEGNTGTALSGSYGPSGLSRTVAAQTHGHTPSTEQCLHGISPVFDMGALQGFDPYFGCILGSSTTVNTAYRDSWLPSGAYVRTNYGTYVTLWRVA